jgi:threonine/homoserine/homoserine lactone efflux protein
VLGNAAGVYVQVLAVAAAPGAVVARSVEVFTARKPAGAAYLVFLGVQAIRRRHAPAAAVTERPAMIGLGAKPAVSGRPD